MGNGERLHDTVVELEQLPLLRLGALRLPLRLGVSPVERSLQVLVFAEPAQRDVDRALQLFRSAVNDVGEDAS